MSVRTLPESKYSGYLLGGYSGQGKTCSRAGAGWHWVGGVTKDWCLKEGAIKLATIRISFCLASTHARIGLAKIAVELSSEYLPLFNTVRSSNTLPGSDTTKHCRSLSSQS